MQESRLKELELQAGVLLMSSSGNYISIPTSRKFMEILRWREGGGDSLLKAK